MAPFTKFFTIFWLIVGLAFQISLCTAQSESSIGNQRPQLQCISVVCSIRTRDNELMEDRAMQLFEDLYTYVLESANIPKRACTPSFITLKYLNSTIINHIPFDASEAALTYLMQQRGTDCTPNAFLTQQFMNGVDVKAAEEKANEFLDSVMRNSQLKSMVDEEAEIKEQSIYTAIEMPLKSTTIEPATKEGIPNMELPRDSAHHNGALLPTITETIYSNSVRAKEMMDAIDEKRASNAAGPLLSFFDAIEAIADDYAAANADTNAQMTDRLPLEEKVEAQPPTSFDMSHLASGTPVRHSVNASSLAQSKILNAFIGTGFNSVVGMMKARQDAAIRSKQLKEGSQGYRSLRAESGEEASECAGSPMVTRAISFNGSSMNNELRCDNETPKNEGEASKALNGGYGKFLATHKEVNPAPIEYILPADQSSITLDTLVALAAGCDCDAFSEGYTCELKQLNDQVSCISFNVSDDSGMSLASVMKAIDEAIGMHALTIVVPVWFDSFETAAHARQATRILRGAFRKASEMGSIMVLPGSYDCYMSDTTNRFNSHPCDEMEGIMGVCVSPLSVGSEGDACTRATNSRIIHAPKDSLEIENYVLCGDSLATAKTAGIITAMSLLSDESPPLAIFRSLMKALRAKEHAAPVQHEMRRLGILPTGKLLDGLRDEIPKPDGNIFEDLEHCVFEDSIPDGEPIHSVTISSLQNCQKLCKNELLCESFSRDEDGRCTLFNGLNALSNAKGTITASRDCYLSENEAILDGFQYYIGTPYGTAAPSSPTNILGYADRLFGFSTPDPRRPSAGETVDAIEAAFDTTNEFFNRVPLEELLWIGSELSASGFFRRRGISKFGRGAGKDKTNLLPPMGAKDPTVTCANVGMTCCVPEEAAPTWSSGKNDSPSLNGNSHTAACTAIYKSQTSTLCATTTYEDTTCGLVKKEGLDYVIYEHTMVIPRRSANNAICQCLHPKDAESGVATQGEAHWAYSKDAVEQVASSIEKSEKLAGQLGNAIAWSQKFAERGSDFMSKMPQNGYDLHTSLPGVIAAALAESRDSDGPSPTSRSLMAVDDGTFEELPIDGFFSPTPFPSKKKKEDPIEAECLTVWPTQCYSVKEECTEKMNIEECNRVMLVEDGCPYDELGFEVKLVGPGLFEFTTRPLHYAGNPPFKLVCDYTLVECSEANIETQCSSDSNDTLGMAGTARKSGETSGSWRRLGSLGILKKGKDFSTGKYGNRKEDADDADDADDGGNGNIHSIMNRIGEPLLAWKSKTDETKDDAGTSTAPGSTIWNHIRNRFMLMALADLIGIPDDVNDALFGNPILDAKTRECFVVKVRNIGATVLEGVFEDNSNTLESLQVVGFGRSAADAVQKRLKKSDKCIEMNFRDISFHQELDLTPDSIEKNSLRLDLYERDQFGNPL